MTSAAHLRQCTIEGCEKNERARGWCTMHYSRWSNTGTTDPRVLPVYPDGMKPCSKCRVMKTIDVDFAPAKRQRYGRSSQCRACSNAASALRNKTVKYGLAAGEYEEILVRQGGVCGACGGQQRKRMTRFCIDHIHSTGEVRGLLCGPCNVGLGMLGDSLEGVVGMLAYLLDRDTLEGTP